MTFPRWSLLKTDIWMMMNLCYFYNEQNSVTRSSAIHTDVINLLHFDVMTQRGPPHISSMVRPDYKSMF